MIQFMKFQIGKSGVTEGTIESLRLGFKSHKVIRISVLKSQAPTKDKVQEIAEELAKRIGGRFTHTIIGFTIILRKLGAAKGIRG
jgi:RNA-binding protein YhbY